MYKAKGHTNSVDSLSSAVVGRLTETTLRMSELQRSLDRVKAQQRNAEVLPRFRIKSQREQNNGGVSSTVSSPGYLSDVAGPGGEPPRKKLRPAQQMAALQAEQTGGTGQHMLSQMQYSIEYLKRNPDGKTTRELEGYLSKPITPALAHVLKHNERVSYVPATDTYIYQPVYNVRNAAQLSGVLDAQVVSAGLSVKDLREGWPQALEELDRMEAEGSVLLIRQKKDDRPKTVWHSSVQYATKVDEDFRDVYTKISVPSREQVARELASLGLKAASSANSNVVKNDGSKDKAKRQRLRGTKVTNTHMQTLKNMGLRK